MSKVYRLKAARFRHPAGTRVVKWAKDDYGFCAHEERETRKPHMAVATEDSPTGPFFTIPIEDLEEVRAGE